MKIERQEEGEDPRHEQRESARQMKKLMESLFANQGWQFLMQVAEFELKKRRNKIVFEPTSDTLAQEFMKGECAMLSTLIQMPTTFLESAVEAIELFRKEKE